MVATPIIQAVIAGIGTIILALSGVVVAIWKHVENLHDDGDSERIDDLQDFRWGQVSSEIQTLYQDVDDYLDENPHEDEDDIEYEAHLTNIVRDGVDLEDLEDLIGKVGELGEPSDLYNNHHAAYESCYWHFIKSAGSLFLLDALIIIALVVELDPFRGGFLMGNAFLGGFAVVMAYEGISDLSEARSTKKDFDDIWQAYRYEY